MMSCDCHQAFLIMVLCTLEGLDVKAIFAYIIHNHLDWSNHFLLQSAGDPSVGSYTDALLDL